MRDGAMANAQLTNYTIATTLDMPELDVVMMENPYPGGPFGAKGLGELPMDGPVQRSNLCGILGECREIPRRRSACGLAKSLSREAAEMRRTRSAAQSFSEDLGSPEKRKAAGEGECGAALYLSTGNRCSCLSSCPGRRH